MFALTAVVPAIPAKDLFLPIPRKPHGLLLFLLALTGGEFTHITVAVAITV